MNINNYIKTLSEQLDETGKKFLFKIVISQEILLLDRMNRNDLKEYVSKFIFIDKTDRSFLLSLNKEKMIEELSSLLVHIINSVDLIGMDEHLNNCLERVVHSERTLVSISRTINENEVKKSSL